MNRISRRSVIVPAAVLWIAVLFLPLALSATDNAEVRALWKDYVVAKKRLQFDTARLLTATWPELEGVAHIQRDQQFALIELRNMKFQYLLENDPGRIVLDDGLSAFADFDWTEADDDALRAANPDYQKLQRWAVMNGLRLSDHPRLSVVVQNTEALQRDENYRTIIERFQLRMTDLETTLARLSERARADRATAPPGDPMKATQTD